MTAVEGGPDQAAVRLVEVLRAGGLTLGCAESLTGGLLTAAVVGVPGASDVLRGGVVAYAPEVKTRVLGVDASLVGRVGTVHADVAVAMARGALDVLGCDLAVATTGVAGPGPSEGHPAGTVYVACVTRQVCEVRGLLVDGDRAQVREVTVRTALELAASVASSEHRGTVEPSSSLDAVEGEEGMP